jgi:2-polyprenyl-3-methyl-5-hydroxy-6-metoxy-1,4-benzoquinol methylase
MQSSYARIVADMELFKEEILNKEFINLTRAIKSGGAIGNYSKSYETWKRARNVIRSFRWETQRQQGPLRIADIGCAHGAYIFLLNSIVAPDRKVEFCGYDISVSELAYAEELRKMLGLQNIQFIAGDASNITLLPCSFDMVICAELIEHIPSPDDCLKGIERILKPGGVAIVTTPNRTNFIVIIKRLFKPLGRESSLDEEHAHVSVKGRNEWVSMMKQCGLRIESIKRGSLFSGGPKFDTRPVLFGLSILVDIILDYIPFMANFTENITFTLRKE